MEPKDYKYNKEEPKFERVVHDDIACKKCQFKKDDYKVNGVVVLQGFSNRFCDNFPKGKPAEVLDGSPCSKFKKCGQ